MYVKEINEVKEHLDFLKERGLIKSWALPYENLLARLNAAIFFFTPSKDDDDTISEIAAELGKYKNFSYRPNHEQKLSDLQYRVTFSEEELKKNQAAASEQVA